MSWQEKAKAQVRAFTRAGQVLRFHTRPQLHPQNVGHHSYGVAWLCWVLTKEQASAALLMAALSHDLPEFITGDLPSPTKRRIGRGVVSELEEEVWRKAGMPVQGFQLTEEERRLLHLADLMEGMMHCVRERSLGNQLLGACYNRYANDARGLLRTEVEQFVWGFINHKRRSYVRD
jgi:5'-deoxynucleotidase YfbR-like HD superfamily hydrolase